MSAVPTQTADKDKRPYRATFGVSYPKAADQEMTFNGKGDLPASSSFGGAKAVVEGKKLFWVLTGATVRKVVFRECNFHHTRGQAVTQIDSLTFDQCDFNRCFLGAVHFRRTTFTACTFTRCEMSRLEFEECTFDGCTFKECTPWDAVLQRTAIDPRPFLDGFSVPQENLSQLEPSDKAAILRRQKKSCAALAEQVLRSNEERGRSLYADLSLYQSRKASIDMRLHELNWRSSFDWFVGVVSLMPAIAFLHLTKGGTSLGRLFGIALAAVFTLATLLRYFVVGVALRGVPVQSLPFAECVSAASSLFLAFGFTNFSASGGFANFLMVAVPVAGLAWSALFFAVIVRRGYR